jgi:hypothetical protein
MKTVNVTTKANESFASLTNQGSKGNDNILSAPRSRNLFEILILDFTAV